MQFSFTYTSLVYAKSITISRALRDAICIIVREHIFMSVPKFYVATSTEPLVNLQLPPLSHLCFTRTGPPRSRRFFTAYTRSNTQLNAFDACFSKRAARLSATARYE